MALTQLSPPKPHGHIFHSFRLVFIRGSLPSLSHTITTRSVSEGRYVIETPLQPIHHDSIFSMFVLWILCLFVAPAQLPSRESHTPPPQRPPQPLFHSCRLVFIRGSFFSLSPNITIRSVSEGRSHTIEVPLQPIQHDSTFASIRFVDSVPFCGSGPTATMQVPRMHTPLVSIPRIFPACKNIQNTTMLVKSIRDFNAG